MNAPDWIVTRVERYRDGTALHGFNLCVPIDGYCDRFTWYFTGPNAYEHMRRCPRYFVCPNPHVALALHQIAHAETARAGFVVEHGSWRMAVAS